MVARKDIPMKMHDLPQNKEKTMVKMDIKEAILIRTSGLP